jgi:hypothetical protein
MMTTWQLHDVHMTTPGRQHGGNMTATRGRSKILEPFRTEIPRATLISKLQFGFPCSTEPAEHVTPQAFVIFRLLCRFWS